MDSHQDKGREKRRFPRLSFREAVKFQIGEYTCPDGGLSKDLSQGGICLSVNEFIPVKSSVIVYVQEDEESPVIELRGIVAWVKILPESERYQVGIEFRELDQSVQNKVNRIVVMLN